MAPRVNRVESTTATTATPVSATPTSLGSVPASASSETNAIVECLERGRGRPTMRCECRISAGRSETAMNKRPVRGRGRAGGGDEEILPRVEHRHPAWLIGASDCGPRAHLMMRRVSSGERRRLHRGGNGATTAYGTSRELTEESTGAMFVDAREIADDTLFRADVRIVGAGAAGITVARCPRAPGTTSSCLRAAVSSRMT